MPRKLFDLAVAVSHYTDKNGNDKNRYVNIGGIYEGDYGKFMMLEAHFNPAGVQRKDGSSSIIVKMFTPKDKNSQTLGASTAYENDLPPF